MFETEIARYEELRQRYDEKIAQRMNPQDWREYNEILFSAHSCAIEGNSFTVDDTRILREQGIAMVPVGKSLHQCLETDSLGGHRRASRRLLLPDSHRPHGERTDTKATEHTTRFLLLNIHYPFISFLI